jgi:putative peptide zinc metalloprotease protein
MLQVAPEETKLRQDLIISPQPALSGTEDSTFVIKDPETEKFFRLREVEYFIVQQLDGSTPLDVIRQRVEERFHAPLTPDTLEQFIKTIRRLGLLEEDKDFPRRVGRSRGRLRGSTLYFRVKLFDPNQLFDYLINKVRFFFTPYFLAGSAAVIIFAAGLAVANSEEIGRDLGSLVRIETVLWVWLTILAATTVHEFAHGLTCKHFGGEVHEVGFLLMYFQPCLYCNVSDAWLFPEKSKRLWVAFAGPYVEFFLAAVVTIVWRLTDQETWLNQAALIVMSTSGVMTFLDFNPLMKRDGYYILSDYLGIPNLRKRAFAYIGASVRHAFGLQSKVQIEASSRERRIYLTYGLLAGTFSFCVLGGVSLLLGNLLIENYQGAGFVMMSAILPIIFRKPMKGLFQFIPALVKSVPKTLATLGQLAKILGIVAVLLACLLLLRLELTVWGEFRIVPIQNTDIRAEVEGIITEILVKEQDRVKKGDVIARLSDRDLRAELQKTEAETGSMQAKLKLLKAGARPEEIDLARKGVGTATIKLEKALELYQEAKRMHAEQRSNAKTAVEKAEERLKFKKRNMERLTGLLEAGFISQKQYDTSEEEMVNKQKDLEEAQGALKLVLANDLAELKDGVAVAEKELEEARGRLSVLRAGSRQEEIEGVAADITRLQAQKDYLLEQLRLLSVTSPISGIVTTPTKQLNVMVGQHVVKGDLITEVHDLATVTAEISVSEKEIADVGVGQKVILKARSYPEKSFEGKVLGIATTAAGRLDGGIGSTVLVLTQLKNPSLLLKPDMTGNAKIFCGKRPLFELITRRIARYFRVEVWSWW